MTDCRDAAAAAYAERAGAEDQTPDGKRTAGLAGYWLSQSEFWLAELDEHGALPAAINDLRQNARAAVHEAVEATEQAAFRAGWDAAMEWRPIETAPKDGTRILLWIEPTKIAMPFEWSGERWMGDDYPLNMAEATHWMPLPRPPASTGEGA